MDRRLGGSQNRSGGRREEKILPLPELELRPLGRPARMESLYRLRYPGTHKYDIFKTKYRINYTLQNKTNIKVFECFIMAYIAV
jgi:hypothetical protein